jgi:CheY-like chemotaxis protein
MNPSAKHKQPVIMIADTDEDERGLLKAILKLIGFKVVEAWDGPQLMRLVQRESPDVLLLDLTLPRLGGRDALPKIRRQSMRPNLPIVAVSIGKPVRRKTPSTTVFMSKPIDCEQLYRLIDRFFPGRLKALGRSKCLPL